jgi:hypothetical protein
MRQTHRAQQNKVMYSLRLDADLKKALETVKERDGIPHTEQIRRALLLWFDHKGVTVRKPSRGHR